MTDTPLRIGLAASARLRSGPAAPLAAFITALAPFFRDVLRAEFHVLGATFDALQEAGNLPGATAIRLPAAQEGGLITMTALLVGLEPGGPGLDWVIHLQDPRDPVALYPEAQALKRQCVVHGKPFLSSLGGTYEWCVLEWHRRAGPDAALRPLVDRWVRPDRLGAETLALIAHDSMKPTMLGFAQRHRPLLERFGRRLATGTTGSLLNGTLPTRLADQPDMRAVLAAAPASAPWVDAVLSGPQGGDAQIAQHVVLGHCRRAVFFEDPHVAREHEADIQLLERATRFAQNGCLCLNSAATADRWAENLARVLAV